MTDLLTRAAGIVAQTFNNQTNQVEATIATPTPVERRDRRGPYLEVLDPAGLDRDTAAGVPVLDAHSTDTVKSMLGRVLSVRIENDSIIALLQFSKAPDVEPITARIGDGTIKNVSPGYRVLERRTTTQNGQRVVTATRWQLVEVSVVANPADPRAQLRSTTTRKPEVTMADDVQDAGPTPAEDKTQIRSMVRQAELPQELADEWIDKGMSLTSVRAELYTRMTDKAAETPKRTITAVGESADDPAVILRRTAKAVSVRMGATLANNDPEREAIRPLIGLTLADHAADVLARSGENVRGVRPNEIWEKRAAPLSTSDFPEILAAASETVLLESYRAAASPLKALSRQMNLENFKQKSAVRLGELGRLQELAEGGEIVAASRSESAERMQLVTFARMLTMSRQMLIDDALGAFGMAVRDLGNAAAATEAHVMADKINNPGNLVDGNPVFHASRGNISGGGILSADYDLGEPRKVLRKRTGLDGETLIDIQPAYLLVDSELETIAEKLLAVISPAEVANVNVFSQKLRLVVEPRLTANAAFMIGDPNRAVGLAHHGLEGMEGPQILRAERFNTLDQSWRVVLDFGCSWLDWRAWQKIEA